MPPKASVIHAPPSPSPPPPPMTSDAQDLLIIHDFMDTLDQIPAELTRVHSDLNELGAVLYSTLLNLETKLNTLIDWIQDGTVGPEQRFQLLQEIAEEAARYKLGADDKIRVAGGACDGIMAHQRHISNLLAASSLLQPAPPSPYTQSLTLSHIPPQSNTRRGAVARAVNSPFTGGGAGGRGGYAGSAAGGEGRVGDTPTKKKRNRVQALGKGDRDDDDVSSVGGGVKKVGAKKRKPANRAVSPTDSLASASNFSGAKPMQPQTARQLAAAANKARKAEQADNDSDDDSQPDVDPGRKRGPALHVSASQDSVPALGLDVGSREGSGVRSNVNTPTLGSASVMPARRPRGQKRGREEDDGDDGSDGGAAAEEDEVKPPTAGAGGGATASSGRRGTGNGGGKKSGGGAAGGQDVDVVDVEGEGIGADGEVDSHLYCTCRQVSYGEMIGCDDDDCEIEWYHLACLDLDKTPEGNWICPMCVERRKRQGKSKKPSKSGKNRK